MMNKTVLRSFVAVMLLVAAGTLAADLDQAKRDGLVGERADGFLGLVVSSAPADVVALVNQVNAKRKAEYERIAEKNGLSLEQVQALAGKKTIEKTRAGDWVFVNGTWQKK